MNWPALAFKPEADLLDTVIGTVQFDLFRDADFTNDIAACKALHPGLQDLEGFLMATQ